MKGVSAVNNAYALISLHFAMSQALDTEQGIAVNTSMSVFRFHEWLFRQNSRAKKRDLVSTKVLK